MPFFNTRPIDRNCSTGACETPRPAARDAAETHLLTIAPVLTHLAGHCTWSKGELIEALEREIRSGKDTDSNQDSDSHSHTHSDESDSNEDSSDSD